MPILETWPQRPLADVGSGSCSGRRLCPDRPEHRPVCVGLAVSWGAVGFRGGTAGLQRRLKSLVWCPHCRGQTDKTMSGARASLCPAQTLRCLRSYLRAQLAEPGWAAGLLGECGRTVDGLEVLSAAHGALVRCLGSSADSPALRRRLRHTRGTMRQQSAATGVKLLLLLSRRQSLEPQDQEQLEHWWLRFAFCMQLFQRDLGLLLRLGQLFPLDLHSTHLINTGMTCEPVEPSSEQGVGEEAECAEPSLEAQIAEIATTLCEVETKVQAPDWSAKATAEAWAEASYGDECHIDSPDMLTEEEAQQIGDRDTADCCTIT
ncbi:regulator of G-protein signaling 9-binding protein-like [Mobula birostris]|uniref:regulator of G-protein signaling 9-binding protein-like n=1 Tax=Mobula birostris TaxID=1983395 RepID=UPI003B2898BE